MLSSRQSRRAQTVLVLTGIILGMYYFFVFRPLHRRSAALDQPLRGTWKRLGEARITSDGDQALRIDEIDNDLREVRRAFTTVQIAQDNVEAAVSLDKSVRDKMAEPFQLVDFQIEELLRIEELGRSAQQNGVTIAPAVFSNFPEYQAERGESELLWGQLALLHQILETAIRCKVSVVQNIRLPSLVPHSRSTNAPVFAYEVPVQVEMVGSMESISKLLAALPQTQGKDAGAASVPGKASLFVDRILLRKNSAENPDEAHLDLQVCGFIFLEHTKLK